MDVGRLTGQGQVRKMVAAFTARTTNLELAFEKLYEAGQIEGELVPQGTLAERIRAAGAGIGAFYTPTGVGTEIAEFVRAVRGQGEIETDGWEGYRALAISMAVYESATVGRSVTLAEVESLYLEE